jgi:hypothetical protein
LKFPRFRSFDGKDTVSLNKLRPNACWGLDSAFGARLYRAVGLTAFTPRFTRVFINGTYYHYMMEWTETGETLMKQYEGKGTTKDKIGDLYESKGYLRDEGPYGISDERLFEPYCGYQTQDRYAATYDQKTNEWRGHGALIEMIEAMHAARATGTEAATRAYFERYWDLDKLLTYVALRNWSAAWDDSYHNHMLYRRSDGKWHLLPWDVENEWNGRRSASGMRFPAQFTFYIGAENEPAEVVKDPYTGKHTWNYVKDTLFRHMKRDFNGKLMDLVSRHLDPGTIDRLVDEALADIDMDAAREAPDWSFKDAMGRTPNQCDIVMRAQQMIRDFVPERNGRVPGDLKE